MSSIGFSSAESTHAQRLFTRHASWTAVGLSLLGHGALFLLLSWGAAWFAPRYESFPTTQVAMISEQDLTKILEKFDLPKPVPQKAPPKPAPPKPASPKAPEVKALREPVEKPVLKVPTKKSLELPSPSEETREVSQPSVLDEIAEELESDQDSDFDRALSEVLEESQDSEESPSAEESLPAEDLLSESILTPEELAAFRRHIYACWSPPIGAPSLETLVVDLLLSLDARAYVLEVRVVDRARMERDPFFRVAAEAALRTLSDPACAPLLLPLDKYDLWKSTILRFDPRRLFGS